VAAALNNFRKCFTHHPSIAGMLGLLVPGYYTLRKIRLHNWFPWSKIPLRLLGTPRQHRNDKGNLPQNAMVVRAKQAHYRRKVDVRWHDESKPEARWQQ
jgi:hypothetical protein